jgi:hypothetical protein
MSTTVGGSFSSHTKSKAFKSMMPGWRRVMFVHGVTQLLTVNERDFHDSKGSLVERGVKIANARYVLRAR